MFLVYYCENDHFVLLTVDVDNYFAVVAVVFQMVTTKMVVPVDEKDRLGKSYRFFVLTIAFDFEQLNI